MKNGGSWFVSDETTTVEIKAPDGAKGTVELRRMSEGDRQDRENELMKMRAQKGKQAQAISYTIGALRRFDFKRCIVGWSLPIAADDQAFRKLDPAVAEQIHTAIRQMNPSIFEDDGDDDAVPTSPDSDSEA